MKTSSELSDPMSVQTQKKKGSAHPTGANYRKKDAFAYEFAVRDPNGDATRCARRRFPRSSVAATSSLVSLRGYAPKHEIFRVVFQNPRTNLQLEIIHLEQPVDRISVRFVCALENG